MSSEELRECPVRVRGGGGGAFSDVAALAPPERARLAGRSTLLPASWPPGGEVTPVVELLDHLLRDQILQGRQTTCYQ